MFDNDTVSLIASAPPLPGLDLKALPQQFTNAYATLVSARIRFRDQKASSVLPEDIEKTLSEVRRIAFSHETFVSVLGDRPNRAASAFVAATAHHLIMIADRLRVQPPPPSRLTFGGISPEVSATLLFLIAESSADAAEMSKAIRIVDEDPIEAALLKAIFYLANGQLRHILSLAEPKSENILTTSFSNQGVRALYLLLFNGVRVLAETMLGETVKDNAISIHASDPQELFNYVKELCIEPLNEIGLSGTQYSVYPGPFHLASLLSSASKDLMSSALVNIPAPSGVDGGEWSFVMRAIAERRPYLWRNHRQAIEAGYLHPGISSVISFPTGAGKSTLAELKIAAALLRGAKVVFLAPTLALVDQTAKALTATFPNSEVLRERPDELPLDLEGSTLPAISVMTPERCLAILSWSENSFADIGLLIFDECHLIHPREAGRSRRAIDAMLCILNFVAEAPKADLLFLSAMVMNTDEISAWLQSLTGRPCLPLTLTWKPTRQVRGCVVYGETEINALKSRLKEVRQQVSNKHPPAEVKRELRVPPFGFFCLHQTWQSNARNDYALLPLLEEMVTLSTGTAANNSWYLTPNGNQVAVAIAASTARNNLKTLIFTQTIPLANSAAENLSRKLTSSNCTLTEDEKYFYDVAIDEFGGNDYLYLEINENYKLMSSSTCHHGLLLSAERQLHESLFKRKDGINVLVATSTLAQGMNLPSEVVIIGGDSRFDANANKMEKLEAHELLNAAGRAGRAGEGAYGFVLVVPSKVVHFNNDTSRIHNHWADLKEIFSQSDQCLLIDDPITALLDEIQSAVAPPSDLAKYFLRRLPIGSFADPSEQDAAASALLSRSLAAFRARARGDENWIARRINAAMAARRADTETPAVLTWEDRLASSAGVPVAIIREMSEPLKGPIRADATLSEWYLWLVHWLLDRPRLIPQLIRPESLEGLFGTKYKKLMDDEQRGKYAAKTIFKLLGLWMAGNALVDLERDIGTQEHLIGKCESARTFVLRLVPELAYIFGLPAQIIRTITRERGESTEIPLALNLLGAGVREGYDCIEKLALRQMLKNHHRARRAVHREFAVVFPFLKPPQSNEKFGDVLSRVTDAIVQANKFESL